MRFRTDVVEDEGHITNKMSEGKQKDQGTQPKHMVKQVLKYARQGNRTVHILPQ